MWREGAIAIVRDYFGMKNINKNKYYNAKDMSSYLIGWWTERDVYRLQSSSDAPSKVNILAENVGNKIVGLHFIQQYVTTLYYVFRFSVSCLVIERNGKYNWISC